MLPGFNWTCLSGLRAKILHFLAKKSGFCYRRQDLKVCNRCRSAFKDVRDKEEGLGTWVGCLGGVKGSQKGLGGIQILLTIANTAKITKKTK